MDMESAYDLFAYLFHFEHDLHQAMTWRCEDLIFLLSYRSNIRLVKHHGPNETCKAITTMPHALHGKCFIFNQEQVRWCQRTYNNRTTMRF